MALSRPITLVYITLIMTFIVTIAADIDPTSGVYTLCNTQNYTSGSVFSKQLTKALSSLQESASKSLYTKISSGSTPLYASYQCRGDMSLSRCSQCVSSAVSDVGGSCPNAIGARVQLDGCFLRYEKYSYFTEDSSIVAELCNTKKDNGTQFLGDVQKVVDRVTSAAPTGSHSYATATRKTVDGYTLYGLAQCQGYLSTSACKSCLSAHTQSWTDCDSGVGAQVHSASCYYRYEVYPFYYTS